MRFASVVRIHPPPPRRSKVRFAPTFFIPSEEKMPSARFLAPPFPNRTRFAGLRFGDFRRGCRFSYVRADETAALGGVLGARRNRRAFPQKSESTLRGEIGRVQTEGIIGSGMPQTEPGPCSCREILIPPTHLVVAKYAKLRFRRGGENCARFLAPPLPTTTTTLGRGWVPGGFTLIPP